MLNSQLLAEFQVAVGPNTIAQRLTEIERLENGDLALVWYEDYTVPGGIERRVRTAVLGEDGVIDTGGIQQPAERASTTGDVTPRAGGGFRTLAEFYNPFTMISSWDIQDYDATGAYVPGPIMPEPYADVQSFAIAGLRDGGSGLFLFQDLGSGPKVIQYYRHAASEATLAGKHVTGATELISAVLRQGATEAEDRLVLTYGVAPDGPGDKGYRVALVDLAGNVETVARVPGAMSGAEPPKFTVKLLADGGLVLGSVQNGRVQLQTFDAGLALDGATVEIGPPSGSATDRIWNYWILDLPGGGLAVLFLVQPLSAVGTGSAWVQYLTDDGKALGVPQFLDDVPINVTHGVAAEFNGDGQLVMVWDQSSGTPLTVRAYDLDLPGKLKGLVFTDTNGNGRYDAGEGQAGAIVTATAESVLAAVATDVTNAAGQWGILLAPVTEVAISVEVGGITRHAQLDLSDGFDPVYLRDGIEWVTRIGLELGGGGDARLVGTRDASLTGDDSGNVLTGNRGDNRLKGLQGDDTLKGRRGDDILLGGAGRDLIRGGDGDDRIFGQGGRDTLAGGDGIDSFVFRVGDGKDVILDFDVTDARNGGGDRLVLSRELWGGGDLAVEDLLALATLTARGARLDFAGGESVLLRGHFDLGELQWSIDLIA